MKVHKQNCILAPVMKRYLLLFLALQIIASNPYCNMGMQTFIKIGSFFHHFIHHHNIHQEHIGFTGFVNMHYSNPEHHTEDHSNHDNLPFQPKHNEQQNQTYQAPCLLPSYQSIVSLFKPEIIFYALIVASQQFHTSSCLNDIWQPPKI